MAKSKYRISKYDTSFDIIKMFPDTFTNKNSKMNNKKNKAFGEFINKEFKEKYDVLVREIDCPETLEGLGAIGWLFCNHHYKEIPCSVYIEKAYNAKLIDFLKKKAKTVFRKIYIGDDYSDIQYVFLYKECYYTISLTEDQKDKLIIHSFSVYHSISIIPDFSEFAQFENEVKNTPKIGIIKTTRHGPTVSYIDHKTDFKFTFDNYNEDFSVFFDDLKSKLMGNTKTGLYLFYGEAGTGKSSAIRHLISEVDRPVVFIPPQMINCLASPDFTDLVTTSLKNSILVIEDAEKALMKRESQDGFFNSELVSSVLNLTDGLYADLSQTAIIATYNCDRNLVDPALLRKGRLRSEYNFKKLSIDRSKKLMDNLGYSVIVKEEMTLADIFNYQTQYTNKEQEIKRTVGFGG